MMNRRLAGLLALLIVLPGAIITRNDFRMGVARFWLSGGIIPFRAERAVSPTYFWAFTAINWAVIALIAAGGLLMVAIP